MSPFSLVARLLTMSFRIDIKHLRFQRDERQRDPVKEKNIRCIHAMRLAIQEGLDEELKRKLKYICSASRAHLRDGSGGLPWCESTVGLRLAISQRSS